ncbi:MAG: hypothetical protein ACRDXX_16690 [Stackebrandtia sp.]
MLGLIRGELRKLFATRMWLWTLLAVVVLAALFTSLSIGFGDEADTWTFPLDSPEGQRTLFGNGRTAAAPLVMMLAAVFVTGEFRHRTAASTFLATPRRTRVITAKLIACVVVAAGYGLAAVGANAAVAMPWLSAKGIDFSLLDNGIPTTIGAVVAATCLYAAIGVGLGAALREQVATTVGLLIYLFVVEPIVAQIGAISEWTAYLPGKAGEALIGIELAQGPMSTGGLDAWQGGLVLGGYAAALVVAGMLTTARKDIV